MFHRCFIHILPKGGLEPLEENKSFRPFVGHCGSPLDGEVF